MKQVNNLISTGQNRTLVPFEPSAGRTDTHASYPSDNCSDGKAVVTAKGIRVSQSVRQRRVKRESGVNFQRQERSNSIISNSWRAYGCIAWRQPPQILLFKGNRRPHPCVSRLGLIKKKTNLRSRLSQWDSSEPSCQKASGTESI